jgi:hypothetical protein
MRGEWGYAPMSTSNYSWGSANLFESDCWAPPPTTVDVCPAPTTDAGAAKFFEATSTMLDAAFTHAKAIGVQSCVGTETPLSKPAPPLPPSAKCWPTSQPKCFQDNEARIMKHTVTISSKSNSYEWCAGECKAAGYTVAGVEYAVACFCDNAMPTAKALPASACAAKCAANRTEHCGDSYTLNAFEFACAPPPPSPGPPPGSPKNYTTQDYYEGMFTRLQKKIPALDWCRSV